MELRDPFSASYRSRLKPSSQGRKQISALEQIPPRRLQDEGARLKPKLSGLLQECSGIDADLFPAGIDLDSLQIVGLQGAEIV